MTDASHKLKARRIGLPVSQAQRKKDFDKYCKTALEMGAAEAKVIAARLVSVDERVRLKCMFPRCHLYGESANCPPYTPQPAEMRQILKKYRKAVVFKHVLESKEDFIDDDTWHKGHVAHQRKTHEVVGAIEAQAFNDGHYFAVGFAAGGCKTALCAGAICGVLDSGRCRFPLKSRPSMEGVGIDVFGLCAKLGWEIYPVAVRGADPDSIACAVSVGIVFIC